MGGTVTRTDHFSPWQGTGSAFRMSGFPLPLPPNSVASELKSS